MTTNKWGNNRHLFVATICLLFFVVNVASASEIEKDIIEQANQERAERGLQELQENELLSKAAFLKAQDMVGHNYFAHTSPQDVDPWHWLGAVEYEYKYAGENLAMEFSSATSVHDAWMKSETHKENIISEKYQEIGVAVLVGIINEKETKVAVQFFGSPLSGETAVLDAEIKDDDVHKEIKLQEVSVRPWEEKEGNEMLVYANVSGNPLNVEVHVGKKYFPLEKVQEHKYMNLISLKDIDLNSDVIVVKAQANEKEALYFQVARGIYAEYIPGQEENEKNEEVLSAVASMHSASLLAKEQAINAQNVILVGFMLVCMIMIGNVWILEKEEEKLLDACHS